MRVNSIKIVLLIFVSGNFLSCNGQVKSEHKQAETKTLEIGKTASELDKQIWRIFQDSKGKYWFGSNGRGIYYLDGKHLKLFTTIDGLVNDTIRGIQEDIDGNIYIETPGGISRFDGKQFTTLKAIKSSYNQWKLNPTDLWFSYNANDLYRYDGDSLFELKLPRKDLKKAFGIDTLISFKRDNPYAVFGVNKDKDGNIWFGTVVAGAFRYDGKSFLWFDEKELSILPDGRAGGVRSMIQDKNGYFWLSNFYYKYKINPNLPKGYEKIKAVDLPKEIAELWVWNSSTNSYKQNGDKFEKFEINKSSR